MTGLIQFTPEISDSIAVGAGAVCGALCRHHVARYAADRIAKDPTLKSLSGWHTAGINILGSFILGGVFGSPVIDPNAIASSPVKTRLSHGWLKPRMKLLLGVGFCGSFTTFSTFSVDVVNMIRKGELLKALSYIGANNIGGIAAAACGMMVVKKIFQR